MLVCYLIIEEKINMNLMGVLNEIEKSLEVAVLVVDLYLKAKNLKTKKEARKQIADKKEEI